MRSRAEAALAALALGACSAAPPPAPRLTEAPVSRATPVALPPEAGSVEGPAGTAGGATASAYDEVGYASWYGDELAGAVTADGTPFSPDAITAAHRTLPLGSVAEVTALDTGRTILVLVNDRGPGREDRLIDLSRGAAAALGTGGQPMTPVRVRAVSATAADLRALQAGGGASTRLDAPPSLLTALRRQLPGNPPVAVAEASVKAPNKPRTTAPRPAPSSRPTVQQPAKGRFSVQVATLSNRARADALARSLGGSVIATSGLYRVRTGPFTDAAAARRARDAAARRGYGDATIITDR